MTGKTAPVAVSPRQRAAIPRVRWAELIGARVTRSSRLSAATAMSAAEERAAWTSVRPSSSARRLWGAAARTRSLSIW